MSNVVACGDSIAFHPGCYIEELVQYSGVSQEEYAKRIGITSEELDLLIKGEISLSRNTAVKLANLLGTSVTLWMNLQQAYDTHIAQFKKANEFSAR